MNRALHAQEIIEIIAACDGSAEAVTNGGARAMMLLMRYAGLRISDVVTLSREHIRGTRLEKRAVKNQRMIRVELPAVVIEALEMLPHPKAARKTIEDTFKGHARVCEPRERRLADHGRGIQAVWRKAARIRIASATRWHPSF